MRAIAWIWSLISLLLGKSPGRWRYSTPSCLAALRLAVKYSVSVRRYIIWAARKASWRRMRSSAMSGRCADFQPINAARGRGCRPERSCGRLEFREDSSHNFYSLPIPSGQVASGGDDPEQPAITWAEFHLERPIRAELFAPRPMARVAIELLDPIAREGDFQCRRCAVAVVPIHDHEGCRLAA